MFEFLFIDLDDTVLDFKMQEDAAIRKTLLDIGVEPTQAVCDRYSRINKDHWKLLEAGQITRQQVLFGRFETLFAELGIPDDPAPTATAYMERLSEGHYFLPGAREAVISLSKKYRLFLASNGTASVQEKRLESAGIGPYFEKIFISQTVGVNKPDKGFFDRCFRQIPGFDPARAMIVGDSPSSDILGGQNAGIATCWVNPTGRAYTRPTPPDYEIRALSELENLLETL